MREIVSNGFAHASECLREHRQEEDDRAHQEHERNRVGVEDGKIVLRNGHALPQADLGAVPQNEPQYDRGEREFVPLQEYA